MALATRQGLLAPDVSHNATAEKLKNRNAHQSDGSVHAAHGYAFKPAADSYDNLRYSGLPGTPVHPVDSALTRRSRRKDLAFGLVDTFQCKRGRDQLANVHFLRKL